MAVNEVSPANGTSRVSDRVRIPMSVPQQKLSVGEIPGYYLHWMRGDPERIGQALRGGYEFVEESELPGRIHNANVGADSAKSGNSDLGTRVSVVAGGLGDDGQPSRLILMKIQKEWHEEDVKAQDKQNDSLRQALHAGSIGSDKEPGSDANLRYVGSRSSTNNMFSPNPQRR